MKKLFFLLIVLCLSLSAATITCQTHMIIIQSNDPTISHQKMVESAQIIESRLEIAEISLLSIDLVPEGKIKLVINDDKPLESFSTLLTQTGMLSFKATKDVNDILKILPDDDPFLNFLDRKKMNGAKIIETTIDSVDFYKQQFEHLKNRFPNFAEYGHTILGQKGLVGFYLFAEDSWSPESTDLQEFTLNKSPDGDSVISIQFSDDASQRWSQMTEKNVHRAIAITLDEKVLMAPVVNEPITMGKAQITGNWSHSHLKITYAMLKSRSLPISFSIVN